MFKQFIMVSCEEIGHRVMGINIGVAIGNEYCGCGGVEHSSEVLFYFGSIEKNLESEGSDDMASKGQFHRIKIRLA